MGKKIGRNDPCPCGSGRKYKRCCGRASTPASVPDRRLMERDLRAIGKLVAGQEFDSFDDLNACLQREAGRGGVKWTPETALEQAQELVYRALEAPQRRERVRLAMEALKISRDCADAYVLLAEEAAESLEQACGLYRQGVEAGERALGRDAFRKDAGHFWGIVETRPYMRAREGLAQCLWELGEQEEAVEHYQEMLHLNPNDNQGIRYVLLACLLELGRLDEAEKLLAQYQDEETAAWLFTRALLVFLRQGDSPEARGALGEALASNQHVAPYLLGQRRMPPDYPSHIEIGTRSEAMEYVALYQAAWARSPSALNWLAAQVRGRHAPAAQSRDGATEGQLAFPLGPSASPKPAATGAGPAEEAAPTPEEWRRLYRAAVSIRELAPWEWMADSDLFAVRNPETGEVGYCAIMGGLGEVFALAVFLGTGGLDSYRRLQEGELKPGDFQAITHMHCLLASFEDQSSLDKGDLAVIRELGLKFRGRHAWPQFRSYRPGYAPWYVTGPEARFLAIALEQAVDVAGRVRKGLDLFEGVDEDLVLVRERDNATRTWQDAWRPLPSLSLTPQPEAALDEARLRQIKERLGAPQGTWEVDIFPLPALIEEPGRRPWYPRAWLCVDKDTGLVIGTATLESWRPSGECQEAFLGILEKAPSLAEVLQVSKEARELLAPLARSLGIRIQERRRLAALERARKSMVSFLQQR